MKPLVSIIITTYNGLDTLERAINSAINQSYDNTEIIVVDDNGLGTSVQKQTEKLVSKYLNTIYYIPHKQNQNGSAARNTGIKSAKGEYIALLDDDDSFRPDKISKQVELMEKKGCEFGLCYTGMMIHFQNDSVKEQITSFEGSIFENAMLREVKAQTSEFLIRKKYALKLNGFDESFVRHQDWEFFDRMSYYYKVAVIPEVCVDRYIYKRTAASSPEQFERNRLFYLKKMKIYIDKLSNGNQKKVYNFHYRSIAKEYIKDGKYIMGLKYLLKSGSFLQSIYGLLKEYMSRF